MWDKDDKGTDREAGTRSEAKLICLPPVVTPHLRCAFHQCTGDFLLLLGLIGFAFTFQLSHKILQMVQPSETQQHEQQRMLIERESKRSWKFGREYDRLQTGRFFGST
jgi:hypothetical protein